MVRVVGIFKSNKIKYYFDHQPNMYFEGVKYIVFKQISLKNIVNHICCVVQEIKM